MKTKLKSLKLVEMGFKSSTISKLNESQIDILYSRLEEQQSGVVKTRSVIDTTKIPASVAKTTGANVDGINISQDGSGNVYAKKPQGPTQSEGEIEETSKVEKKKDDKNNPWAICHAQLGPKKNAKFERCVKQVKKSLEEGKNPVSLFLENKIMNIVEKHIPPRITKSELIKHLIEGSTKTAPAKPKTDPKTDPKTKPGKPAEKPGKPSHPFKNPNPGEKESPKAKKETNEGNPAVAPSKPKTDPKTKPGKPAEKPGKPSHPFKNPNPGEKESPKAVSPEAAKDKVIDVIMNLLEK